MKESEITKKRLTELSERAFERNYTVFSEFLNINEISILRTLKLPSEYTLFGGYDNAERCIAGFCIIEKGDFPIVCIKMEPVHQKFADKLTHRDFLGSLMNLGINRNMLGDIKLKNNVGYLFCQESISGYIVQRLDRVRHTTVKCEIINELPDFISELPETEDVIVSSLRADTVISAVYQLSRNETGLLFSQDKVFINARLTKKESAPLKNKDIISLRGYGRFIFEQAERTTKKGRIVISIRKYR